MKLYFGEYEMHGREPLQFRVVAPNIKIARLRMVREAKLSGLGNIPQSHLSKVRAAKHQPPITKDGRYVVQLENTGDPGPRFVARFCDDFISSHLLSIQAFEACCYHDAGRLNR